MLVVLLQAAELQQYGTGQKAVQEEMRELQKAAHKHEEACSKAEVGQARQTATLQQLCGETHTEVCYQQVHGRLASLRPDTASRVVC